MPKKHAKEQMVDFYYLNTEEDKNNKEKKTLAVGAINNRPKNKEKVVKKKIKKNKEIENQDDDKFNFDNEIVIGVNLIPEKKKENREPKATSSTNNKAKNSKKKKKNSKKKKENEQKNSNNNRKEKKKKLSAKEQKRLKTIKIVQAIIKWIILISLLIGSIIFVMMSPIFNIVNINVSGNSKITKEEIINLSKINIGDNIYKMNLTNSKKNIKSNSYIESVEIKRKIPNVIDITVKERTPKYMLQYGNQMVYINSQGYILEISDEILKLPILIGYKTENDKIVPGSRLVEEDLNKLEKVIRLMDSANSNGISDLITKINIENKEDYVIILETKGITVYLGDMEKEINEKMRYLKEILNLENGSEGELFLEDMSRKYFREKV